MKKQITLELILLLSIFAIIVYAVFAESYAIGGLAIAAFVTVLVTLIRTEHA